MDVGQARARARHQVELDGQDSLADDHQRRVVDEAVEHGGHRALDGVLDGHEPGVGRARADRGQHGRAARARHQLGVGRLGQRAQRLLGERGPRTEEADARHARRPRADSWAVGRGSRSTPQRDTNPRTPLTARSESAETAAASRAPSVASSAASTSSPAIARATASSRLRIPCRPVAAVHDLAQPQHGERASRLDDDLDELLDVPARGHVGRPRAAAAQLRRAAVLGHAAYGGEPGRGAFGVVGVRAAGLDDRDHVLRHELRHAVQPHRVDVRRRGRLDRARGEQARSGEHRGQRLGDGAEPRVDDQRDVDRAAGRRTGQLRDERGQPRHGAHQLTDEAAVAPVARGQVAGHRDIHIGGARARPQQARVVDELGEQGWDGPRVRTSRRRHDHDANGSVSASPGHPRPSSLT